MFNFRARKEIEQLLGYPADAFNPDNHYMKVDQINEAVGRVIGEKVVRMQDILNNQMLQMQTDFRLTETPGREQHLHFPEYDPEFIFNIN